MKQKDIALIAVISIFSAVVSFIASNKIFVTPSNREQKVIVVDKINSEFTLPSTDYFNGNSIDPTQLVTIGANNNTNPFSATQQQ